MKKLELQPTIENLEQATAFFEDLLSESGVPMKVIMQVNVAVDEIFSNIAHYSGAKTAVLGCLVEDHHVTMQFWDDGTPYDPTSQEEPDVTLSAQERKIGGLGIFMVKKIMDEVAYVFEKGQNVLTLKKSWQ